jgi:NAD(P)-dependent dehydrogenase (short-subunit alcohol dehydrogenase family)
MLMSDPPVQVIIGANGATGSATVRRLTAAGSRVIVAGRTLTDLEALAAETGAAASHELDARDIGQVEELMARVSEDFDRVDGVANLVGSVLLKPAHLTTPEEWAETLAVNLTSAFAVVRSAAPRMGRNGGGSIVLASSAAAQTGIANHEAIAAAKAGICGLARSAAATYGARGVRVNAVAPGLVEAKMTERLVANEAQADASRQMHVLGRLGTGDDVAAAVAWLLDPATSWVTGQVIGGDGGLGQVRTRPKG